MKLETSHLSWCSSSAGVQLHLGGSPLRANPIGQEERVASISKDFELIKFALPRLNVFSTDSIMFSTELTEYKVNVTFVQLDSSCCMPCSRK